MALVCPNAGANLSVCCINLCQSGKHRHTFFNYEDTMCILHHHITLYNAHNNYDF